MAFVWFLVIVAITAFAFGFDAERQAAEYDRRRVQWFWFCVRWGDIGRQYARDHIDNITRNT